MLTATTGPRGSGWLRSTIQMACLEARQLDRYYVDTEHLLLGLAREPEGGAARILADLGVDHEEIRRRIPETPATDE